MAPTRAQESAAKTDEKVGLDERDHQRGCPVATGDSDRGSPIEAYQATRPATATEPAVELTVIRCVQCGGERAEPVDA